MVARGAVAAGHAETARAASIMLEAGGNAFDAALAAMCAACAAEPVLTSMGGGGFLLARPADGEPILYDFFAHTPKRRRPTQELDFRSIHADFGTTLQEFHIGLGAMATPGAVKGLFDIHRDLGRMPLVRIVEPAVAMARDGITVNALQASTFQVVRDSYLASAQTRAVFESQRAPGSMLQAGETCYNNDYADFLDNLVRDGAGLFYRGEPAQMVAADCAQQGGHLGLDDFAEYRVQRREPLRVAHGDATLYTNPPPSSGGILIAFSLALLRDAELWRLRFGEPAHAERLARVMQLTNRARVESEMHKLAHDPASALLDPALLADYRSQVLGHPPAQRGTTHISVIDADGNAAALTFSNGEGAGYMIPGTGVMMNNMLGEDDINPHGFHLWPTDTRMASMMAPTLGLRAEGPAEFVLGSGGSNRIRTAILQVLLNLLDFGAAPEAAVNNPRMHLEEDDLLDIEAGYPPEAIAALSSTYGRLKEWPGASLFFGGVHCVWLDATSGRFTGAGDPRRGGVFMIADGSG